LDFVVGKVNYIFENILKRKKKTPFNFEKKIREHVLAMRNRPGQSEGEGRWPGSEMERDRTPPKSNKLKSRCGEQKGWDVW